MQLIERGLHVDELKKLFYIDEDWQLRWKVKKAKQIKIGAIAGTTSVFGYRSVTINNRHYRVHRIIWALHYGEWPTGHLDHINGIKDDNSIENLRVATTTENARNQKLFVTNKTRLPGVSWNKATNKWESYIYDRCQKKHLGTSEDFFEVVCARKSAELQYGFHANHGRSQ
jgi:hypothetical protein